MRVARQHRSNRVWAPVQRVLLVLLWLAVLLSAKSAEAQRPMPWWQSTQFQKDLGMTSDQVAKVDAIFQATLPELRARRDELEQLEMKLSNLIEADADETAVARWVDKTETARGALNKVRTLMLMRMRQVLTPDQRTRFRELHDARDRHRHNRDPGGPPSASTAPKR